jgi:hypothetical protein
MPTHAYIFQVEYCALPNHLFLLIFREVFTNIVYHK